MLKRFRGLRVFCSAFMLTLCMLLLGVGFLVAEYNTRRMITGNAELPITYMVEEGKVVLRRPMSKGKVLPPQTEKWAGRMWVLLPARYRTAAWLTEAEQMAAPYFLQWLADREEEWAQDYVTMKAPVP